MASTNTLAPPKINDWNRFDEWVDGLGELAKLLEEAEISPGGVDFPVLTVTTEWDLNRL